MYRAITIAREFGSGGATVAQMLAERLQWKLLDRTLLEEIARSANVDPRKAERFDECVDPWLHRLFKQALWRGAIESVPAVTGSDFFDSEEMANIARRVIQGAAEMGNCVVVGRGAQCILHGRKDTFHLFLYGPWNERLRRVRQRFPNADCATLAQEMDRKRSAYIREYFQKEWCNPHLYDLMMNTRHGEEAVVRAVLAVVNPAVAGA
jgi:cytidylate kinase